MKIYKMRIRINNSMRQRNALGLKHPFYEAMVNDVPLTSVMINPDRDSKKLGRAFAWGYHGVFPTNLALSVLSDLFDMEDYSNLFSETGYGVAFNKFYNEFICENKKPSWEIAEDQLWDYMGDVVYQLESEGLINA